MAVSDQELFDSISEAIRVFAQNGAIRRYKLADGREIERTGLSELLAARDNLAAKIAASSGVYEPLAFRGDV